MVLYIKPRRLLTAGADRESSVVPPVGFRPRFFRTCLSARLRCQTSHAHFTCSPSCRALRPDDSSPRQTEQKHTTQFSRSVVVHYIADIHCSVRRSPQKKYCRGPSGKRSLVCLPTDNTWVLVPEWMTSRETHALCQLSEAPEISISALLELDAALGCSSTIGSEKHPEVREGGRDGAHPREQQTESAAVRAGGGEIRSGASSAARTDFKHLVAETGLGHIGVIFAIEVSRLARNNRD
jgi:hypothetical protein